MNCFENILLNPCVNFSEQQKAGILSYLRENAGFLFGRHNCQAIAQKADTVSEQTDETEKNTIRFIQDLLKVFSENDDILVLSLFQNIMNFFKKYSSESQEYIKTENDMTGILQYLDDIKMNFDEAYDILYRLLNTMKRSEENDLSKVKAFRLTTRKGVSSRKYIYMIGLASNLTRRKTDESPVISDKAIEKLVGEERAAAYTGKSRNELIQGALEYRIVTMPEGGFVSLSFPYYDQEHIRVRSCSGIFEHIFNKAGGKDIENITDHNSLSFLASDDSFENNQKGSDRLFLANHTKPEEDRGKRSAFLSVQHSPDTNHQTKEQNNTDDPEYNFDEKSFLTFLVCPKKYAIEKQFNIQQIRRSERRGYGWLDHDQKQQYFNVLAAKITEEFFLNQEQRDEKTLEDEEKFEGVCMEAGKAFNIIPYEHEIDKEMEIKELQQTAYDYFAFLRNNNNGYTPWKVNCQLVEQKPFVCRFDDVAFGFSSLSPDRIDKKEENGTTHYRIVNYDVGTAEDFIRDHNRYIPVLSYLYTQALSEKYKNTVVDEIEFVFPFDSEQTVYRYSVSQDDLNLSDDIKYRIRFLLEEFKEKRYYGYEQLRIADNTDTKKRPREVINCPYKRICGECKKVGDDNG